MSFLPLVARELRVAARQPATRRVRLLVASAGMLGSILPILVGYAITGGGRGLFTFLTVGSFLLAMLAGALLTADSLSHEKREGTLGLLFLTDLKGFDVVAGKLVGRSLKAVYGLLALIPLMSLAVVLGGVSGREVLYTTLALLNAVFFSLAAGVFVSACSRDATSAFGYTLGLVFLVTAILPAGASTSRLVGSPEWLRFAANFSPWSAFSFAADPVGTRFWPALLACDLLGWAFLAGASAILPRAWQERPLGTRTSPSAGSIAGRPSAGSTPRRHSTPPPDTPGSSVRRDREILDRNPIWFLIGTRRRSRLVAWVIVAVTGAITIGALPFSGSVPMPVSMIPTHQFGGFLLKLVIVFQVCAFFSESRRTGALELLATTPVTNADVVRGQWLALRDAFLWPVVIFLLLTVLPFAMFWSEDGRLLSNSSLLAFFLLDFVIDVAAAGWVGMWFALSLKKPANAPLLTVLLVLVIPAFFLCGVQVVPSLIMALWARDRLRADFRQAIRARFH